MPEIQRKSPSIEEYLEAPSQYPEFQAMVQEMLTSWRQMLIEAAKSMERVPPSALALAEMGWTMHPDMSPREIVEYSELSQEEVDATFEREYFDGAPPRIDGMLEKWARNPEFEPWHRLLMEIRSSLHRGEFAITVPALLLVLEGYIARVVSREEPSAIRDPNPRRLLKRLAPHGALSITSAFWVSTAAFMERLFAYQRFDGVEPSLINRHWILHGRSSATWQRVDAARLIHAIFTMQYLFRDFKNTGTATVGTSSH